MRKRVNKLVLNRETLRRLDQSTLQPVVGAVTTVPCETWSVCACTWDPKCSFYCDMNPTDATC